MFISPVNARLLSCPQYLRVAPAIQEAFEAFDWFEAGQLRDRFPHAPVSLMRAVTEIKHGVNAAQAEAYEEMRRKK